MEKESRGQLGTLFKWMFIVFNVMMAGMVYLGIGHTEESNTVIQIGVGMGISMLGMIWAAGFVVLGALTYFTRVKKQ